MAYTIVGHITLLLQISTNGLLSFEGPFDTFRVCDFPCTIHPVVAPDWNDFNFERGGIIYNRATQDPDILNRAAALIFAMNPALNDYEPTQAVIVTWLGAPLRRNTDVREIRKYLSYSQVLF